MIEMNILTLISRQFYWDKLASRVKVMRNFLHFPDTAARMFSRLCKHKIFLFFVSIENTFDQYEWRPNPELTRSRERYLAAVYYMYISYSYTWRRCGLRAKDKKKEKNRQEKRYCGRSASRCEADCSLRWNCPTETLRNNWWLLVFFFCLVRSGGRTPLLLLITLSDTVGRTYIPSYYGDTYRSVTIYHWSVDIAILQQVCRQYGRHVRTGQTENELSPRAANYDANLPKPIVTRTFQLFRIIFRGVQCGT